MKRTKTSRRGGSSSRVLGGDGGRDPKRDPSAHTTTSEDEELVTNALQTLVNLAPLMDLQIFSSSKPSYIKMTEKRAAQSITAMLGSPIKAWHCASAELLGRLIIDPDNEPFLLPFVPQIYKRLVDLLGFPAVDSQAAAVGALYYLAEVNMDCRLKLAGERWAVDRLIKIVKTLKSVPEVCRKAAMILESLVAVPQNRPLLAAHGSSLTEIALRNRPLLCANCPAEQAFAGCARELFDRDCPIGRKVFGHLCKDIV